MPPLIFNILLCPMGKMILDVVASLCHHSSYDVQRSNVLTKIWSSQCPPDSVTCCSSLIVFKRLLFRYVLLWSPRGQSPGWRRLLFSRLCPFITRCVPPSFGVSNPPHCTLFFKIDYVYTGDELSKDSSLLEAVELSRYWRLEYLFAEAKSTIVKRRLKSPLTLDCSKVSLIVSYGYFTNSENHT